MNGFIKYAFLIINYKFIWILKFFIIISIHTGQISWYIIKNIVTSLHNIYINILLMALSNSFFE